MIKINDLNCIEFINQCRYAVILLDAKWNRFDAAPIDVNSSGFKLVPNSIQNYLLQNSGRPSSGNQLLKSFKESKVQFSGVVDFAEIDIDESKEFAKKIKLLNIPAIAYCRDGEIISVLIGAAQNINEHIATLINNGKPAYPKKP